MVSVICEQLRLRRAISVMKIFGIQTRVSDVHGIFLMMCGYTPWLSELLRKSCQFCFILHGRPLMRFFDRRKYVRSSSLFIDCRCMTMSQKLLLSWGSEKRRKYGFADSFFYSNLSLLGITEDGEASFSIMKEGLVTMLLISKITENWEILSIWLPQTLSFFCIFNNSTATGCEETCIYYSWVLV